MELFMSVTACKTSWHVAGTEREGGPAALATSPRRVLMTISCLAQSLFMEYFPSFQKSAKSLNTFTSEQRSPLLASVMPGPFRSCMGLPRSVGVGIGEAWGRIQICGVGARDWDADMGRRGKEGKGINNGQTRAAGKKRKPDGTATFFLGGAQQCAPEPWEKWLW